MTAATPDTVAGWAVAVLSTADPWAKVALTRAAAAACANLPTGRAAPPDRPARPARPELRRPGDMAKRSTGPKGRLALVHALAHIELNAIDLAWDIIARFAHDDLTRAFVDDWVGVAIEEAEHFFELDRLLKDWGGGYGDLPAHDGLWRAAAGTADDLLARLAIIPLTLEARGLDTTPETVARLRAAGEQAVADVLDVIYADEIKHLAVGMRWFDHLCRARGLDPAAAYRATLAARFSGRLKGPFNIPARAAGGMDRSFFENS
ncbi:MAG: ferritin-like domain-containing protein [Rhodospirillaceae bacterium]|nr:ferritin-like domain-containing protein [Rhodospirillaceae bacterium]